VLFTSVQIFQSCSCSAPKFPSPGLGTTESKDEYRPSFMDHFDKMFETPPTTNHVNERRSSDSSTNSQVVMRRTESPFSPPKKFGPGDFEFVSSYVY
jgi:hypothetical protein